MKTPLLPLLLLLFPLPTFSKAILGIDLGSLYMKVALVQRNSPLEIVTNLHSKRKTEQMVLFDASTRFYGADASSLLARKPLKTPSGMSVLLGRDENHPAVKVLSERHYPLLPTYNTTRSGLCLTIPQIGSFTPEELVAMILTHAKDITISHGVSSSIIKDCVLTVPSFYTQHERRALLDAASLADLNVLALIEENTAAALHFGMDRIEEEEYKVLFYNMGASSTQVTIVTYYSYEHKITKNAKGKKVGAFDVKGKGWDETLGGSTFDHRLMEFMADEFNTRWNSEKPGSQKDVREYPKAMTKLRLQANKAKHILSANTDIPLFMDALQDDVNLHMHISRAKFEEITHDLMTRAVLPIHKALQSANMTLGEIDAIELIGGGMRIPKVQESLKDALQMELGKHINSDESMALGAAFHGANVSTAFRVRQIGMSDVNPFPIAVSLEDLEMEKKSGWFGAGKQEKEGEEEKWEKRAVIFKPFGKIGVKKTIAFTHDRDVHCAMDYDESDYLPEGTERAMERYNITGIAQFAKEMSQKDLPKPKISLQFELSSSGITSLVKAEAAVDEIITVEEEVEVEEDEEIQSENGTKEDTTAADEDTKTKEDQDTPREEEVEKEESKQEETKPAEEPKENTDEAPDDVTKETPTPPEEKPKEEKTKDEKPKKDEKPLKKKTKLVKKEKKKVHKQTLTIATYQTTKIKPYSPTLLQESKLKLRHLQEQDDARIRLEQSRNKVESYIYHIKNKLSDEEEEIAKVTTEEQRSALQKLASDAEDWLYDDGYDAVDVATFEDKYAELYIPAREIFHRLEEVTARPEALEALSKKLEKVEELMTKWKRTMPQVTDEEHEEVSKKVKEIRQWMEEMETKQAETEPWETPVFDSKDVPLQMKPIEVLVKALSKKPKPKVVELNETKGEEETKENVTEEELGGNETVLKEETIEVEEGGDTAEETKEEKEEETKEENKKEEEEDEL